MAFRGLPPPPNGYERAVLRAGDSLASLSDESGVPASVLASANGVGAFPGSCAWGNEIGDMALAVGGGVFVVGSTRELAAGDRDRALCGRDCRFKAGNVINLPRGVRAPSATPPPSKKPPPKKSSGAGLGLLALLLGGGVAVAMNS